jgi:hypothetical protein
MVMTWMAWIGPEIPEYSARVWAGVPTQYGIAFGPFPEQ